MIVGHTIEKHHIRKKKEFHTIKIVAESLELRDIKTAISKLVDYHQVPENAYIRVLTRYNVWVKAYWVVEK